MNTIYPISFSIPKCKIVKKVPNKTKWFGNCIPGDVSTYIFNNERDYYNDYSSSVFGHTKCKGGWDCMRHYEILASGSIPDFRDLYNCPKEILTSLPKDLIFRAMQELGPHIKEPFEKHIEKINSYTEELLEYTRNNCTTEKAALYILEKSNNMDAKSILFLSGQLKPDYLRCTTLHGFKELFEKNCHDYPHISHLYTDYSEDINNLYGKGISYSCLLDPIKYRDYDKDDTIIEDITNQKYDIIIYGQVYRGMPYWDLVKEKYPSNKIIFLCGEDINWIDGKCGDSLSCKEYSNYGHLFIRELYFTEEEREIQKNINYEELETLNIEEEIIDSTDLQETTGLKNLIYMCVFHQENYINLLKLLITSISVKANIDRETTDILIITCPSFQPLIQKELEGFDLPIHYYILDLHTLMEASCSKLKIFQYEHIDKYQKILYLDTDVLVNSDVNVLFNLEISSEKLYALEEGNIGHEFWGVQFFDFTKFNRNTPAFSAGVFYIMNSLSMKILINETNLHIENYLSKNTNVPYCLDQPFLVYNSFIQEKYDNQIMKTYLELNPSIVSNEKIVYHFPGDPGFYNSKYNKMTAFWEKMNEKREKYSELCMLGKKYSVDKSPFFGNHTYTPSFNPKHKIKKDKYTF